MFRVDGGEGQEGGSRVHDQSRDNGVLGVREVVVVDRDSSCRLAPESDTLWITTKIGDVVTDPFESQALVKKPKILLVISKTCCVRLSEDAQAVSTVDVNSLDTVRRSETLTEYQQRCACRSAGSID